MTEAPTLEDAESVLVVEGYSDLRFLAEGLEHLGKHGRVFIKRLGGKEELCLNLESFLTPKLLATKRAIGVALDADGEPLGTAQALEELLARLTNQKVTAGGWTAGPPKVGLFIAPDGVSTGEIETLAWRAWSGDPRNREPKKCVEAFVTCMANAGWKAKSPDKGLVSALLAVRNDDDPRLGPGAQADVFDFDRPEFVGLLTFLNGF